MDIHVLKNKFQILSVKNQLKMDYKVASHCGFILHLWLVTLSIFSHIYWPSIYPLEKCLFRSFTHLIGLSVFLVLCKNYVFWKLFPHHMYHWAVCSPMQWVTFHFVGFICCAKAFQFDSFFLYWQKILLPEMSRDFIFF